MTNLFKALCTLTLIFTLNNISQAATNKPSTKPSSPAPAILEKTVYAPAINGPINLFRFFFENDGPEIETFYATLKKLERDDQGTLIVSEKLKPSLRKKMLIYKNDLALINPYLGGTLMVFDLSAMGKTFNAPFEFSIKGATETLATMKDCLKPDAPLKVTLGRRTVIETKKFGQAVLFFCYENNSSAVFKLLNVKAIIKPGEKLGQVTSGNAFMCILFTQNAKADPKAFIKTPANTFLYQQA